MGYWYWYRIFRQYVVIHMLDYQIILAWSVLMVLASLISAQKDATYELVDISKCD